MQVRGTVIPPEPTLDTAVVNGDTLTLTYDEALDDASVPDKAAFTLGGVLGYSVDTVAVSGMAVTLTLSAAVISGDVVTVSYAVPDMNPLQDEEGNDAVALTMQSVTNNTPPMLVGIGEMFGFRPLVSGNALTLPYDDALDESSVPDKSAFTLAGTAATVSTVTINSNVVSLALSQAVSSTDVVTVSYTVPDMNPLRNAAGINVAAFTDVPVQNITPPAPTGVMASSPAPGKLEVSWMEPDPLGSIGDYQVQLSSDGGSNWSDSGSARGGTAGATITHVVTGLAGGMYHARVSSRAFGSLSPWVQTASAVTVTADTTVPTLDTAVVNGDMLTLTYDEVLDEDSVPSASAFTLGGSDGGNRETR